MDTVHAALLDAVRTDFLAEAGRVAGQGLRQGSLVVDGVDELADHRVLGGTNQVQVLALDLIHHVLHFLEGHNALDHVTMNHERRDIVGEAAVDHEVACVGQDGRMQARDIALEVVEAVARGAARGIEVDAVKRLHDIHMVGNLIIRHDRVTELLDLDVLGVVLADRDGRVDDVRNDHHTALDFLGVGLFVLLELCHLVGHCLDLSLDLLGLVLLALGHQAADLLGLLIAHGAQLVTAGLCRAELRVKLDDLVDHRQLLVLELLLDVLLDRVRVLSDKFDIQHGLFFSFISNGLVYSIISTICSVERFCCAASNSLLISASKPSSVLPSKRSSP